MATRRELRAQFPDDVRFTEDEDVDLPGENGCRFKPTMTTDHAVLADLLNATVMARLDRIEAMAAGKQVLERKTRKRKERDEGGR